MGDELLRRVVTIRLSGAGVEPLAHRAVPRPCRRLLFGRLWSEAWEIVSGLEQTAVVPSALTEIGLGASSLSEWEHATAALRRALDTARERNEADVVARAEAALESVGALLGEMPRRERAFTAAAERFNAELREARERRG